MPQNKKVFVEKVFVGPVNPILSSYLSMSLT